MLSTPKTWQANTSDIVVFFNLRKAHQGQLDLLNFQSLLYLTFSYNALFYYSEVVWCIFEIFIGVFHYPSDTFLVLILRFIQYISVLLAEVRNQFCALLSNFKHPIHH